MNIFEISLSGSVVIVLILAVRTIGRNRIPKRISCLLWVIAALRLLIPFTLPYELGIWNGFATLRYNLVQRGTTGIVESEAPAQAQGITQVLSTGLDLMDDFPKNPLSSSVEAFSPLHIMQMVWLIGLLAVATVYLIGYFRCRSDFREAIRIDNSATYFVDWKENHRLKRPIAIKMSDRILSPLTYGVFHPVILLPKRPCWQNETEMNYIMEHEFTHIKYRDVLFKQVMWLVVAVHWFNPLIWVMFFFVTRDMELACDERVIRILGREHRRDYAMTLLQCEEKKTLLNAAYTGFSKQTLKERIGAIMKIKRLSLIGVILSAVLILATVFVGSVSGIKAGKTTVEKPSKGKLVLASYGATEPYGDPEEESSLLGETVKRKDMDYRSPEAVEKQMRALFSKYGWELPDSTAASMKLYTEERSREAVMWTSQVGIPGYEEHFIESDFDQIGAFSKAIGLSGNMDAIDKMHVIGGYQALANYVDGYHLNYFVFTDPSQQIVAAGMVATSNRIDPQMNNPVERKQWIVQLDTKKEDIDAVVSAYYDSLPKDDYGLMALLYTQDVESPALDAQEMIAYRYVGFEAAISNDPGLIYNSYPAKYAGSYVSLDGKKLTVMVVDMDEATIAEIKEAIAPFEAEFKPAKHSFAQINLARNFDKNTEAGQRLMEADVMYSVIPNYAKNKSMVWLSPNTEEMRRMYIEASTMPQDMFVFYTFETFDEKAEKN